MDRFRDSVFLHAGGLAKARRVILGKNVVKLRNLRGLTQEGLAERAGLDRRYVQRIERGTANPGVDVIGRLRDALDVAWEELLD